VPWRKLESALDLLDKPDFVTALAPAKDYFTASRRLEAAGRRKTRWALTVIFTLLLGIIAGLVAFINQEFLKEQYQWRAVMGPTVLTAEQEREKVAKPGSDFKEWRQRLPNDGLVPAASSQWAHGGSVDEEPFLVHACHDYAVVVVDEASKSSVDVPGHAGRAPLCGGRNASRFAAQVAPGMRPAEPLCFLRNCTGNVRSALSSETRMLT
jgi:hypothetical protein